MSQIKCKYGISRYMIHQCCKQMGVKINPRGQMKGARRQSSIPVDSRLGIIQDYISNISIQRIANMRSLGRKAVANLLKHNGAKIRKPHEQRLKVNHDAFADAMINEEAAYWVGFIMADGNVSVTPTLPQLRISLSAIDKEHLEKFKSFLKSEHKIREYTQKTRDKYHPKVSIAVSSSQLCGDLATYGVGPGKTNNAKAHGGIEINRHFWRGCIDGDGSMSLIKARPGRNKKRPILQFCGTKDLVNQFYIFSKNICESSTSPYQIKHVRNHWRLAFNGYAAQSVINHLYSPCTIVLARKLKIAEAIMNHKCGRPKISVT